MGRKKYKQNSRGTGRFVALPFAILKSDAWRACNSNTRDVYVGLLMGFNGHTLGNYCFTNKTNPLFQFLVSGL